MRFLYKVKFVYDEKETKMIKIFVEDVKNKSIQHVSAVWPLDEAGQAHVLGGVLDLLMKKINFK